MSDQSRFIMNIQHSVYHYGRMFSTNHNKVSWYAILSTECRILAYIKHLFSDNDWSQDQDNWRWSQGGLYICVTRLLTAVSKVYFIICNTYLFLIRYIIAISQISKRYQPQEYSVWLVQLWGRMFWFFCQVNYRSAFAYLKSFRLNWCHKDGILSITAWALSSPSVLKLNVFQRL